MTMQIADSVSLSSPEAKARAHAAAARNNLRTEPKAVRIAIITESQIGELFGILRRTLAEMRHGLLQRIRSGPL